MRTPDMINDIQQTELEKKLQRVKEGYTGIAVGGPAFTFPERVLSREEVIELCQKGLDLFAHERVTRAAHEAAVEAKQKALPALRQLHVDALKVARSHYGADEKKMATFGVVKPIRAKRHARPPEAEVVEEVTTTVVEEVSFDSESELFGWQEPERGEESPKLCGHGAKVPERGAKPRPIAEQRDGARARKGSAG
jgi:hypothetical protein